MTALESSFFSTTKQEDRRCHQLCLVKELAEHLDSVMVEVLLFAYR